MAETKQIRVPKPADPFAEEINRRLDQLRQLNERAPAKPSLKMFAVQLKALSMAAERLVR